MERDHHNEGRTLLCRKDKTLKNTWLMPNSRLSILHKEYPSNFKGSHQNSLKGCLVTIVSKKIIISFKFAKKKVVTS